MNNDAAVGGFAIEFIVSFILLVIFIVMAVRIGKIKKLLERIDKRLPVIVIGLIISSGVFSQCPIPLQSKVIKWCGSQMIISPNVVDSNDFHYDWRYPSDSDGFVSKGSPAPYNSFSFVLSKAGLDSLAKMSKHVPYFMLKITSDSGCESKWVYINITHFPIAVETPTICLITVDSVNRNHLILAHPSITPDSIVLEKLSGNKWTSIHTIKKTDLLEYTDEGSDAAKQTYSYRLISYLWDSCLLQTTASVPSVVHTSILLQVSPNPIGGYNLLWSKYVGLNDSELQGYYIYRGSSYASLHIIDTSQSLQNVAFTDPYSENIEYFYVVEAIKKSGCDIGQHLKKQLSVRSNTAKRLVNDINTVSATEIDARIINGVLYSKEPVSVNIYSVDGKLHDSFESQGKTDLNLKPGLWLIQVSNKTSSKTFRQAQL